MAIFDSRSSRVVNRAAGAVACLLALAFAATTSAQSFSDLREAGVDLPPRLGITVTQYSQTQPYDIQHLSFEFPGVDPAMVQNLVIDNRTDTTHVMIDYWLFPFLDVFVLGGHVDGTTTVNLGDLNLDLPIRLNDIRINYSGTVYGGGLTLAGGWKSVFSALTYEYTSTSLDVSTSDITAWVASLKIGYQVKGGAVWVGTMYQHTDERDRGSYVMPFLGTIPFDVEFNAHEPLNYLIGATAGFNKHWNVTLEAGFGDRDSAMVSLGYRF
jgi:hypothetical protein